MTDQQPEPSPRSAAQDYSIGIAVALVLAATVVWLVRTGMSEETAEGLEPQIAEHFTGLLQTDITVDCPDGVKMGKDKISDCVATRVDTRRTSPVFVTAVDGDGHYRFQLGNPTSLMAP